MPDVIIVGGGIIGAACAYELSRAGASVTLIERDELAAGASGRNAGLWVRPTDLALQDMARRSLERYLELADAAPVPFDLDPLPLGTVLVPLHGQEEEARASVEAYRELGVGVQALSRNEIRDVEPAINPDIEEAWLVDDAHRLDPAGLTVSLALIAGEAGAEIRHHLTVRSLVEQQGAVRGVVTDEGRLLADDVVVATGPWSQELLDVVETRVPVLPVRGWLVRLNARPDLLRHEIAEAGWREALERANAIDPVRAEELSTAQRRGAIGVMVGPYRRGGVLVGTSRQAAVTPEPEDPSVPLRLAALAVKLLPELARSQVLGSWWGLRPMTPDERPLVGRVREGLVVATGHGSEGVILGAGTGQLVTSIVNDSDVPFDGAAFDPFRFEG